MYISLKEYLDYKMHIGIYTYIYGGYEDPKSLNINKNSNDTYDFICFTDDHKLKSDFWQMVVYEPFNESPLSKWLGIANKNFANVILIKYYLSMTEIYRKYNTVIFIDSNMIITDPNYICDISNYIVINDIKEGIILTKNLLKCLYHELILGPTNSKYNGYNMKQQIEDYANEGPPPYWGSYFNGMMVYVNPYSKMLMDFYPKVIEEVYNPKYIIDPEKLSLPQMQPCFAYCLWKYKIPFFVMKRAIGRQIYPFIHKVESNVINDRIVDIDFTDNLPKLNNKIAKKIMIHMKSAKTVYIKINNPEFLMVDVITSLLRNESSIKIIYLDSMNHLNFNKLCEFFGITVKSIHDAPIQPIDWLIKSHPDDTNIYRPVTNIINLR